MITVEIERLGPESRWDYRVAANSDVVSLRPETFVCGGMVIADAFAGKLRSELEAVEKGVSAARAHKREDERNRMQRESRRAMKDAYESCGMVKVRGALGGTYWE